MCSQTARRPGWLEKRPRGQGMEEEARWCGSFWVFVRIFLKLLSGSEAREFWGIFVCLCGHARTACRILVPQPGIEPMSRAVEVQSLNHWTTRKIPASLNHIYIYIFFFFFFFNFLARPHSIWDLSLPTRYWTCVPCSGSTLKRQGSPKSLKEKCIMTSISS